MLCYYQGKRLQRRLNGMFTVFTYVRLPANIKVFVSLNQHKKTPTDISKTEELIEP